MRGSVFFYLERSVFDLLTSDREEDNMGSKSLTTACRPFWMPWVASIIACNFAMSVPQIASATVWRAAGDVGVFDLPKDVVGMYDRRLGLALSFEMPYHIRTVMGTFRYQERPHTARDEFGDVIGQYFPRLWIYFFSPQLFMRADPQGSGLLSFYAAAGPGFLHMRYDLDLDRFLSELNVEGLQTVYTRNRLAFSGEVGLDLSSPALRGYFFGLGSRVYLYAEEDHEDFATGSFNIARRGIEFFLRAGYASGHS
jgi:hypothetical protein